MIDLTVKTLDSRNHAFSMPDDATVQQLKAKIEETMNIPANRQRLIFHGRVMQDDKKLSEYEVHGMVIHLVKSQPPQPGSRQGNASGSTNTNASDNTTRNSGPRVFGRVDGSAMFGSVVIPVIGDTGGGRHGAWRLMSTAERMIQRANEVICHHEHSTSRSTSAAPSATTTPYNSSRDSSGSHSPTAESTQPGGAPSDAKPTTSSASAEPSTSSGAAGMDTDMETDNNTTTPSITVSNADQPGASVGPGNTPQEGSSQDTNQPRQQRGVPSAANMSALLSRLRTLQTRFNPLLTRYHRLITDDPPTSNAQQLAERLILTQTVPEVLHLLSHAYHAISELTIDWELSPPRQMRPLLAPAIQQLVQLTEGMNPWGLPIPTPNFIQQQQTASSAGNASAAPGSGPAASSTASASTGPATSTPANASAGVSNGASGAGSSPTSSGGVPEVTYMTTTFPAEGGEATTTFSTRPATNFEAASAAATASGGTGAGAGAGAGAAGRTPVVTASIDFTGRNPGFTAALNAAYAVANRIAALHQATHHPNQQQQEQQQPQPQSQQQPQQPPQQPQQPPQQPQPTPQQQPTSQSQQQQGQNRGSIVTVPVGMIDIPANVEFFMEVGPSTITIDSVEATIGTTGTFTPGTNGGTIDGNPLNINFPWGSNPPQEFLQGMVHALSRIITNPSANPNMRRRGSAPESTPNPNMQRRGSAPESESMDGSISASNEAAAGNASSNSSSPGGTGGQGQTSQARGYTATHPTTSTQTRSTSRPHVHHFAATNFPGYSVGFSDPFLPCHSQFFASWRRPRSNASGNASATANSATQTNPTNPTNAASSANPSTPANPVNPSNMNSANASANPVSQANPTVGLRHLQVAADGRLINPASGSGPTVAQIAARGSNRWQRTAPAGQSLANYIEGIASSAANGNALETLLSAVVTPDGQSLQANVPIVNLLLADQVDAARGVSLLTDFQLAAITSITMHDVVSLFEGSWEAINHVREDIYRFICTRLCPNTPNSEMLQAGISRFLSDLRPHYNVILDGRLRDGVDAVATLERFHQSIVPEFFHMVVDDNRADTFGRDVHEMAHRYLGCLWAIVKYCCIDDESVETVFQSYLRHVSDGRTWSPRLFIEQLRQYIETIIVPFQDIEPFIVHTGRTSEVAPQAVLGQTNEINTSENVTMEQSTEEPQRVDNSLVGTIEPMDMDPQSPPQASASASTLPLDTHAQANSSEGVATARSIEMSELLPMDTEAPPPAPEAWHRIVPPEWVPIIARDATRQRRPSSQPPLSDAYLAGMPPKRRKLVTSDKPQGTLGEVISANMESAIQSAGVSRSVMTVVQEEASRDPRLREAYREQLRATVRANLANNPDYSAERYPNVAKYFGKS